MSSRTNSLKEVVQNPKASPSRLSKRAEQQRALATRSQILEAAISEFAEKGFEAASIRGIAERIKVQHPLITYHFKTKDILWQAAAEYAFGRIRAEWDELVPRDNVLAPLDRLRSEYRTLFRYTTLFPDFHRFMLREGQANTARLHWMAETVIDPLLKRLLPQVKEAQATGLLPKGDPLLFHYMMVSLTSTLCNFELEMKVLGGLPDMDAARDENYWRLVDELVFGRSDVASRSFTSVDAAAAKD